MIGPAIILRSLRLVQAKLARSFFINMEQILQDLNEIAEKQGNCMRLIREEARVMDIDAVRRIKGLTELILELEVQRQTLTSVLVKQNC